MPLTREQMQTVCKEVVIPPPQGKGAPLGGITCTRIPLGTKPPPGYAATLPPSLADIFDLSPTIPTKEHPTMCGPDKTISPRTRAAHYSQPRNVMAPARDTAPFSIAGLAPQASSAALDISAAGIPRAFRINSVILSGVTADEIVVTVLVGGEEAETFTGEQLAPSTANPCIGAACGTIICAGSIEDISLVVTNISGAALGATDSIRVLGTLSLEGDANFVDCWRTGAAGAGLPPEACGLGGGCGAVP